MCLPHIISHSLQLQVGLEKKSRQKSERERERERVRERKMSEWFRSVCTLTVGDLVHHKTEIISVEASTSLGNVLNLLKEQNILSVPIYGTKGCWLGSGGVDLVSNHRQYIGIVSIIDIIIFILKNDPESVLNCRIVEAIGSTNESLSLWVEPSSRPVFYALEQFCKGFISTHYMDLTSYSSPFR